MMVCLCVSSPKNIPFNKEKPKHAERWVVVQLPDGFWMCWCPSCWSSTLLIPRRNSEKSKILDVEKELLGQEDPEKLMLVRS